MIDEKRLKGMVEDIREMRRIAERLRDSGKGIQTVERNAIRILSSIRLLELNMADVLEVL